MKNLKLVLVLCLTCLFTGLKAQVIKYADINSSRISKGYTSYISKDGTVYKVGDTLKINKPSVSGSGKFLFIKLFYSLAEAEHSGRQTIIKEINIVAANGSRSENTGGYYVEFKGTGTYFSYLINIEDAIANGEVKGLGLSSDEALTLLKKAKDKLDLQVITQEEYNKTRSDLIKFIR